MQWLDAIGDLIYFSREIAGAASAAFYDVLLGQLEKSRSCTLIGAGAGWKRNGIFSRLRCHGCTISSTGLIRNSESLPYFLAAIISSCDQFHFVVLDVSEMGVPLWQTFLTCVPQ